MNERIRELIKQAGMELKPRRPWDDNDPNGPYLESDNDYFDYNLEATRVFFDGGLEKFAEMIIQECMLCCERVISDPVPNEVDTWLNGGNQCVEEIKYHFGIE